MGRKLARSVRDNLVSGLMFIVPAAISIFVVYKIVAWLDDLCYRLMEPLIPKEFIQAIEKITILGVRLERIPGLGIVSGFIVILIVGALVRRYIGRKITSAFEGVLRNVPLLGDLYVAVKQIMSAIFTRAPQEKFAEAVLVNFPHRDSYSFGFVTGKHKIGDRTYVSIFVPTTPNPTSGFLLLLDPQELEKAQRVPSRAGLKVVISGGFAEIEQNGQGGEEGDNKGAD